MYARQTTVFYALSTPYATVTAGFFKLDA